MKLQGTKKLQLQICEYAVVEQQFLNKLWK
jgi:hypothetical protein